MALFNDPSAPGVSRAEAVERGHLPWGRVKQDGGEPSPRVAGLMPEGSAGSAHHSSWKTERVCGQGEPQAGRWVNFGRKSCSLSWGTDFTGGGGRVLGSPGGGRGEVSGTGWPNRLSFPRDQKCGQGLSPSSMLAPFPTHTPAERMSTAHFEDG